ncbi:allophanate hydrolase [Paenibacillus athensensis]|uniref:Allophanate hydrolase n=1 Tax=Paenibacillus athensensis TaxID=1967502 RepID=A0A4Y8PXY0_9BACL|nr:allophanate hydrolase [Paenibacillus athensensis]
MKSNLIPFTLTISGLRALYASGALTPQEVIAEIISRSVQDYAYNIWILAPDWSHIQPYLERLKQLDPTEAPLWGIPFAIKDNLDQAGLPTTAACAEYAYEPKTHAAVVERLLAAGAIPVGKTNLDQFATGLVGVRSPYGETANALRPELISGGSSSGSAVAVARGQAAFALGTDTAGSGRVPAALNGLVGWKPSVGAWPTLGVVPACASLDCVTVFAHELDDVLVVDQAVRGPHDADPWSRCVPLPEPEPPGRLLLPKEPPATYGPFAAEYRSAWLAAVERLQQLDLPIAYIDTQWLDEAASLLYEGPWVAERWAGLGEFIAARPGAALEVTERILRSGAGTAAGGRSYDAAALFQAQHRLQGLKLQTRRLLAGAVLVLPTCGGTWTREQVARDPIGANRDMGRYTNHCNLLDLCAVAVPAGEAAPQTPYGITLFALAGQEGLLCSVAQAFSMQRSLSAVAVGIVGPSAHKVAPQPTLEHSSALAHSSVPESLSPQFAPASPAVHEVAPQPTLEHSSVPESLSPQFAPASPSAHEAAPQPTLANPSAHEVASSVPSPAAAAAPGPPTTTPVAVCGLHMRGFPLEAQMLASGARFVREAATAPLYRLVKLPTTPSKPGLIQTREGGASIRLEVWEMPLAQLGAFTAAIPAPLGIGKVRLSDGAEVPGFVCEAYAAEEAEDVTAYGSWRAVPGTG